MKYPKKQYNSNEVNKMIYLGKDIVPGTQMISIISDKGTAFVEALATGDTYVDAKVILVNDPESGRYYDCPKNETARFTYQEPEHWYDTLKVSNPEYGSITLDRVYM